MFCKNCGNKLKDGAKFCPKCGASVKTVSKNDANNKNSEAASEVPNTLSVDRNAYIGKAYTFDYYIGVNLPSLRISRRAVGFNEDNLLYCKGLNKTQIPYSMIKEIKDETKISTYALICIAVFAFVGIICLVSGGLGYALISAVLAALTISGRNCREISIVTTDNKTFKIKAVPKNNEINQFITYLKNETGIK